MAQTLINSDGLAAACITRSKLNTTLAASAVIAKILAGSGLALTYTGVDSGTGDVTIGTQYPQKSIVSSSSGINSTETYISAPFLIAANTLVAGMSFKISASGTCTSTVANTCTFNVRLGTAGTTSDSVVQALSTTAVTSGTAVPFRVEALVTIRTIGSTGTAVANLELLNNGVTGLSGSAVVLAAETTALTINTTVANYLGLSYVTVTHTTTTCTFSQVTVEQVG